jgi:hypothetical protein
MPARGSNFGTNVGGHYHHCADFHRPITAHVVRFRNRHMTSKGTSCVSASQVPAKKLLISRTLTIIVWTTNPLTAILSCLVRAILKRSSQWFCTLSSTNTANLQRKRFEIERIRSFMWWKINPFRQVRVKILQQQKVRTFEGGHVNTSGMTVL